MHMKYLELKNGIKIWNRPTRIVELKVSDDERVVLFLNELFSIRPDVDVVLLPGNCKVEAVVPQDRAVHSKVLENLKNWN